MSDGSSVDTDSLRRFRGAVKRVEDRVGDLRGLAEAARLPPGTFTRSEGGQVADGGHSQTLDSISTGLDAAVEQLRAIAEATARTADNYEATDERHAAAMSNVRGRLAREEA